MMRSGLLNNLTLIGKRLSALRFLGALVMLVFSVLTYAEGEVLSLPPAPDANCVVTALNRSAPLQSDYRFTLTNLPRTGTQPFRVRTTCSDGTVGETVVAFPLADDLVTYMGDIFWRPATPIPLGLLLNPDASYFQAGSPTHLTSGLYADDNGNFALNGILQDSASIPLPVGTPILVKSQAISCGYSYYVGHPITKVQAPVVTAAFENGANAAQKNLIFPTGILRGAVTGPLDVSIAGGSVSITTPLLNGVFVQIQSDGRYELPGVPAGTYDLFATVAQL